jgi:hypothetical protein
VDYLAAAGLSAASKNEEIIFQQRSIENFSNRYTGTTPLNMAMQRRTISFLGKIFSRVRYLYSSGSAPLSARV